MTARKSAPDFVVYGPISVQLWGQRFVAGIRFFRDVVHGVTLTLEQSKVAALGCDATEKDLLAEKKTLTAMLLKQLECSRAHRYEARGNLLDGVQGGPAEPWSNQPGNGTQYQLRRSVQSHLEAGELVEMPNRCRLPPR